MSDEILVELKLIKQHQEEQDRRLERIEGAVNGNGSGKSLYQRLAVIETKLEGSKESRASTLVVIGLVSTVLISLASVGVALVALVGK